MAGRTESFSVIAHYNFSASCEVVGSPEGLGFAPSHSWLRPKNPTRAFSPLQPDQIVTLSLETPLSVPPPKNPEQEVTLSLHPPIKAQP